MAEKLRFMPKYVGYGKEIITPKQILEILENKSSIIVNRSWTDPGTGQATKPILFKIELSSPEEPNKALVVFKVLGVDLATGKSIWLTRGTVAQSSFLAGRDCIGCEGVRYTRAKHLEVEKQLLLNSPKARNHRLMKLFTNIKKINS